MRTIWEYMKKNDRICILKAYGENTSLKIPSQIEGALVTEVGPYAFSMSELPKRFRIPPSEICRYVTEEGVLGEREREADIKPDPVAGDRLESIYLPDTIEVIGDYAFYGCRKLNRICFTDSLKRIGSGAFMGCVSVREFGYRQEREGNNSLYQMLSELRYAITVEIEEPGRKALLVFPEYYEMSVENVPARIFEVHFHGTGYRYRQCFRGGAVDYRGYDELFRLAVGQESPVILTELAAGRLKFPVGLGDEAKKEYLSYFSIHARKAGKILLEKDDLETIRLIAEAGGFDGKTGVPSAVQQAASQEAFRPVADGAGDFYMASLGETTFGSGPAESGKMKAAGELKQEEALDVLLEIAGRMGRTECTGFLLDYRHRKRKNGKKKVFDL